MSASLADLRVAQNLASRLRAKIEYEFELEDEFDWGTIWEFGSKEKRANEAQSSLLRTSNNRFRSYNRTRPRARTRTRFFSFEAAY